MLPYRHRYRLHIVAEAVTPIEHCLLALPGVRLEELARVISDPPALAHCDPFLRGLPGLVREAVDDTAGAAKMVAANGWRWGCSACMRTHTPLETHLPE